jgi:cobalamin transport system substrate-binding protein
VSDSTYRIFPRALLVCAALALFPAGVITAQTNAVPSAGSAASPATAAVMHEVTDGYGRAVRVPLNPSRIISLAPSLTETLYALGVEDRLVGDTDYCDYPPEAQKKPKVGGVINPNLEQIAALHPDLVLLSKEGNMLDTVRALDTLGIPTYATDTHTIDQIISSVQKLADVLNAASKGKALADDLQLRLQALQAKLNGVPPKTVLFIVWPEPLMSVGKGTFVADALRRAGAASIVDANQDWPQVSFEEVARLQPEYLVFAAAHTGFAGNDFESVANRPGWQILDAVRERHYAVVSEAIIRPAPRIVSVIEDLAHQLHPEVFAEKPGTERQAPPAHAIPPPSPSNLQPKPTAYHLSAQACLQESPCAH